MKSSMIILTGSTGTLGKRVKSDLNLDFRSFIETKHSEEVKKYFTDSTLIHLAGVANLRIIQDDPAKTHLVNVKGALDLFQTFAANRGKRFIFASSGHVYGHTKLGYKSLETDTLNPQSKYAEQKIQAEKLLINAANEFDTELIILRIFSIFGSGMRSNYLAGMIEHSLKESGSYPNITTSDDVRDFSEPEIVGNYINKSVKAKFDHVQILNICSGNEMSVRNRVLKSYPLIPVSKFITGYSSVPRLIGDPNQMSTFLDS